jgi:hypothetical protein
LPKVVPVNLSPKTGSFFRVIGRLSMAETPLAPGRLVSGDGPDLSLKPVKIAAHQQFKNLLVYDPKEEAAVVSRAKRRWKHRQGVDPELKKELASTGLWNGERSISNLPGEQRMSRVLLDFVAPYTATAESEEQFRTAIQMGRIAWNMALLPPDVRQEKLESLIKEAVFAGADDFRDCIKEMVERKEKYFADCRRWILAHRVEMTRRGPSLSVVSTAE